MTKKHSLLILIALFVSCTNKRPFDIFDFTMEGESAAYSIEFTQNDTVFIRYNFSYLDIYDSIEAPKSKTNYYAILERKQREEFDDFIHKTEFNRYDTSYYDNFIDGSEYQIYIKQGNYEKSIYVHSRHAPQELDTLSAWIDNLVRNLSLIKIDKKLVFKSKLKSLPFIPPQPKIANDSQ